MKSYVPVTFAFLAFAFYLMSGGDDFVPRKADVMAAAAQAQAVEDARRLGEAKATPAEPAALPQVVSAEVALAAKDQTLPVTFTLRDDVTETDAAPAEDTPPEVTLVSLEQSGDLFARPLQQLEDQGTAPNLPVITLAPVTAAPVATEPPADLRRVTGTRVNMRAGPGTDFAVLGNLVQGDEVEVIRDEGIGWVKLRTGDGQIGWMAASLLSAPTG